MTASFQLLTSFVPPAAIMSVMLLGEILCGAFPGRNYGIHGIRDIPRLPLRARPGRVARRGNEFSSAEMVFPGRQGKAAVQWTMESFSISMYPPKCLPIRNRDHVTPNKINISHEKWPFQKDNSSENHFFTGHVGLGGAGKKGSYTMVCSCYKNWKRIDTDWIYNVICQAYGKPSCFICWIRFMWILFALQLAEASCLCRHRYMGCHRRKSREFAGPWRWPEPETSGDGRERGAAETKGFLFIEENQVMCWIVFVAMRNHNINIYIYINICFSIPCRLYPLYLIWILIVFASSSWDHWEQTPNFGRSNLPGRCSFEQPRTMWMHEHLSETRVETPLKPQEHPGSEWGFEVLLLGIWLTEPMVNETAKRLNLKVLQKSLVWK